MDDGVKGLLMGLAEQLYDKHAQDIVALDVAHLTILTESMLIVSGRSIPHVKALHESLEDWLALQGKAPRRREGVREGRWIVLDCEHVIVHIFHEQERGYYNLERLWMDGANRINLPFIGNIAVEA